MSKRRVIRGLIIREPYVYMVASGAKRWEVRKYNTRVRGYVALISRGYLYGFANLVDVFKIKTGELKKYRHMHKVPDSFLDKYARGNKELYVWVFSNPLPLRQPLKVRYSRGAQVWAYLDYNRVARILVENGYSNLHRFLERRIDVIK